MARNTYEAWIPEEEGSQVIQRVNQMSAVERFARRVPMGTNTRTEPRSAGLGVEIVPKGSAYGEDESVNDEVVLTAKKFGKAVRIAEEDLDDSLANIISVKQSDWAVSYSKMLDNACLATTGAANGTTVPFDSVYREADSAGNVTQTGSGGVTYAGLSAFLGGVEGGDYFQPDRIVVIAHPAARAAFRGVMDDQGHPIFVQGLAGTPDTLFGHEVAWSLGAKTSATATDSPTGNPLLIAVNRDLLILGTRSGPESMVSEDASFLTDEPILKLRSRRAFALGHADGAAVLEVDA